MSTRPFRFALQAFEASSAEQWFSLVHRAEQAGYSTLFSSDHYFGPGAIVDSTGHRPVDMAPLTSIAMAAAVTSTLRVGCRVFNCDLHNAVVLAKEMATLDLLSSGRLEVGLGAGWIAAEYAGLGVPMASAGTRIAKLAEFAELMRAQWSGEPLDINGTHATATGFAGLPIPATPGGPPLMIGGGAPKVLGVAGRLADIVSLNFNNSSGRLGPASVATSGPQQTAEKIEWIKAGAGDRFDQIEIEIGAYMAAVGDTGAAQLGAYAQRFGVPPEVLAQHPHAFFGSVEQVCDTLQERRERYGISYVTVSQRNLDEFVPVIEALAGR